MLQTLAIMFTGKPIAFSKGSFGAIGGRLEKFAKSIKNAIKSGKQALNEFKKNFNNKIRFKSGSIEIYSKDPNGNAITTTVKYAAPLERLNETLDYYTKDNYKGLEAALPGLFSNTQPSVANARNELLNILGNVNQSASYKIGPFSIGELSLMGETTSDSFAEKMRAYSRHTDELSGVANEDVEFTLQRIYGNVTIANATVNIASSVIVSPNLSRTVYPVVNIGDTVVINNEERVVVDKIFTAAPAGTVSVNIANSNTLVVSSSVGTLNLANCLLDASGTLKVNNGIFINVNNEIRQVASINALGDYLTVYSGFSENATVSFYKETAFNVNTALSTTSSDLTIKVKDAFVCNSICLDNVITGNGTSFTSVLQSNNKIYYDAKEYYVVSVTDTTIVVDEPLRKTDNFPIYKITNETAYVNIAGESNNPDDILSNYALAGQLTNDKTFLNDFTVTVRRANGVYQTVNAGQPIDSAQSLLKEELLIQANQIIKDMINDYRTDAIKGLSESALVSKLTESKNRIQTIRDDVDNVVQQDLQVINQVKGLIKGLVKLFTTSCSKKKRKDGDSTSDDYLDLILDPDPQRQGCDATTSDFIDILDDIDLEFGPDEPYPPVPPTIDISATIPNNPALDPSSSTVGPYPTQPEGAAGTDFLGNNIDGNDPDVKLREDPCAKPC